MSPAGVALTAIALALAGAAGAGCKGDPVPVATLIQTSPGTDKQPGEAAWVPAAAGATFFRGDAIRTADGIALLRLNQRASLRVQPHSLIRFGEQDGRSAIDVKLGEATLEGSGGSYQLGAGGLALDGQSSVRITAGDGGSTLELVLGKATLDQNGSVTALEPGKPIALGLGEVQLIKPDAAPVADAAPPGDAAPDAAPPVVPETVALVVKGKKAQYLPEGETAWMAVPVGASQLPGGTALRLGPRTSAVASRPGVTLELPTGARLGIGGDPFLALEVGRATASGTAGVAGRVGLPGGHVVLEQGAHPSGASIEIRGRDTRVVITRGAATLVGKGDKVELQHGETAVLTADGAIEIIDKIPRYFDLRVTAGESFVIHDPRPGTAVRFGFECSAGAGSIELVKGGARRVTTGSDGGANAMLGEGDWSYRQRCDGSPRIVKRGRIDVVRGSAQRELPRGQPPLNHVKADGIDYTIVYQNRVPNLEFHWPGGTGSGLTLHLSRGKQKSIAVTSGTSVIVPGGDLAEGRSTFYFTNAAGAKSPVSRLEIQFDNAIPTVYIESPDPVAAFPSQIEVKGATLSGWTVSIDGAAVPVDKHGRFSTQIGAPAANALAIRLAHPKQGVHYYLRRHP